MSTVSSSSFCAVNSGAEWKKQLVTKEDPNHVHKSLGILVLCSYIWRLCLLGDADLGFAKYPQWTVPTLLLHLALNASSFEFRIPQKRINSGYRIWPEYRLHSFVFLCRSLAMMLLFWAEREYNCKENHLIELLIILATMAAADWGSHSLGKQYQSGFARELDVPAVVKYFFSLAQLNATAVILMGQRRYTMQFLMVIIIQVNAFLMTLRRKNLASQGLLMTIYGLALASTGVVSYFEYHREESGMNTIRAVSFITNMAVLLRTSPRILPVVRILQDNKYLLWVAMYFLQETYIRPALGDPFTPAQLAVIRTSNAAMVALGVYKHFREPRYKVGAVKSA